MLRVALVDDEPAMLDQLRGFLEQYCAEQGMELQLSEFHDGSELLEHYRPVYDIIFMDVEMPKLNGMEAAEVLRTKDSEVVLVFITNLVQYAIRGYAVRALDYVLKPVNYYTFTAKLERALEMVGRKSSGQIMLRLSDGAVRLDTKQIYYVEIQRGMLHYFTQLGEFTLRGTLQSAEEELRPYHFVRCNYWYLVNLQHVTKVQKDTVEVAGKQLEISRRNRQAFLAALTDYVGGGG